jgi:hypothetical protein
MKNEFVTYKYYTKRGDRAAIFAEIKGDNLEIVNIYCSHKDKFCKGTAKEAYLTFKEGRESTFHPETISIPIQKWETARGAFFTYCEKRFYRKSKELVAIDILRNGRKTVYLKTKLKKLW